MHLKILTVILILSGVVMAQGPGSGRGFNPKNVDAVRIWKLTEALELTEEQTVTFLPLVQIHERKLRVAQQELQEISREGYKLLEQDDVAQKDVDKMIKRYTKKQDEIHKIKHDFIKSLPKYLSPKQQILYIGFEARFRNQLRKYMKDRRGDRDRFERDRRP